MISLRVDGHRFQLRAAAVVLHQGHVLAHRGEGDVFWSLPGGRVEAGEHGALTLRREMLEELGEALAVERLLFVAEAFFDLAGERNHELGLYFLAHLGAESPVLDKTRPHAGLEGHTRLEFRWLPLAALDGIDLRPGFLKQRLASPPTGVEHVVHVE